MQRHLLAFRISFILNIDYIYFTLDSSYGENIFVQETKFELKFYDFMTSWGKNTN